MNELEEYQYGVHVQRGRHLYMMSEKKIYFGDWLIRKTDPIIIIEMGRQIADREAPFYLQVNDHKNIIHTFGSVTNPLNLTIFVQEYAPQGDLADFLMDGQFKFTQPMFVQMFAQIADAMNYVASKKIVHGDLGCRNVLVFRVDISEPKNNLVKITDFGLARWIEHPPENEDPSVLPIRYCATEILRNNRHSSYSEKSDVYSMGVLIWEALSYGVFPYSSIADDKRVAQMKLNNEKLLQPQECDRQLWVLMNNCWNKEPQQRPTFDEIKDRLSNMNISEVPHSLITASSHKAQIHCDYELDIDVQIIRLLNDDHPSIYEAQWVSKEDEEEKGPVVLIEKNEEPSEHEKLFYTTFKNLRHIVRTFGFVGNDRGSVMILQERSPYGNLQSLLETGQFRPSAKVLVEIFKQIIDTMIDVAREGLVHGDLRCENILVFQMHPSDPKRNLVKLANFTLAHRNDPLYSDDRRLFVPVRYCAPEILRSAGRSNYSELSDVYSMGVLMWQAFSKGKRPYDSSETNREVRQRKLKEEKLPMVDACDGQIWTIMTEYCWHNEPTIRFTFKELKIQLSKINFGRSDNDVIRSDHSNKGQRNNDKENDPGSQRTKRTRTEHQKTTTVSTRSSYTNDAFVDDTIEESPPTKRKPVGPPKAPNPDPLCKYCGESYPECLIDEHQTSHCRKRFDRPVITNQPKPFHDKQPSNNDVSTYRPKPPVTAIELQPRRPVPTRQVNQQHPSNTTIPHQESFPPKSKSSWSRFCPCLCLWSSKN